MEKWRVRGCISFREHPGAVKLIGIGLASGACNSSFRSPPLIPLSNTIPAVSVVLLTVGLIERDGVFVLFGYFVKPLRVGLLRPYVRLRGERNRSAVQIPSIESDLEIAFVGFIHLPGQIPLSQL
jgi:hypothetical protein